MKRNTWAIIVFVATLVAAVICYAVVFTHYDQVWWVFMPILWLCLITFVLCLGIFASAILVERKAKA